jgi:arylsulfatase A-like enzyme
MFTGLLPHQHGASGGVRLGESSLTLARLLQAQGYETAGFNSNFYWGQRRLGLGQGFDIYDDGSSGFIHNATCTLVGAGIYRLLYCPLVYPDFPAHRNAAQTNQAVIQWLQHRSGRSFFLFINYFDPHAPYLVPSAEQRFGNLSYGLVRKLRAGSAVQNRGRFSATEIAELVSGYDNCLAYVDGRIGELLGLLAATRDASNTIVVVTSDHGESLGERGYVGHGYSLNQELLHVPLIIAGAGIPEGMQITDVVSTRRIFATILSWASRVGDSVAGDSLSPFWSGRRGGVASSESAISELSTGGTTAFVSLMTSRYHYILDERGQRQLFDWHKDPQEENNLASLAEYPTTLSAMEGLLEAKVRSTPQPWLGLGYAAAFGMGGSNPTRDAARAHSGAISKPPSEDEELLENLPY